MFDLVLERKSVNRLNVEITRKKLRRLVKSIERRKSLGFTAKVSHLPEPQETNNDDGSINYYYSVNLRLKSSLKDEQKISENLKQIIQAIERSIHIKGWQVLHNNKIGEATLDSPSMKLREPFVPPVLTESVFSSYFGDIYEREAHIRVIHDSVQMFVESGGKRRSHVLLHGKPAAAKTSIFERFKLWYEEKSEWERIIFVDGPTLTKAGFEKWIMGQAGEGTLPEIIVIEEIEKQNVDNLLSLLSVMQSGYLMRTNAHVGKVRCSVPTIIWATCNDETILRNFRNGALWSRFSHKWECQRPGPNLTKKILEREVQLINGNPLWVDKVMEIVQHPRCPLDDKGDIREIIALLDGRNRLLDGSYLNDLLKINSKGA